MAKHSAAALCAADQHINQSFVLHASFSEKVVDKWSMHGGRRGDFSFACFAALLLPDHSVALLPARRKVAATGASPGFSDSKFARDSLSFENLNSVGSFSVALQSWRKRMNA